MFPELARDDVFRLETRRLWLRWPRPQDVADIARHAGDRAVALTTGSVPHPYPPGTAAEFVLSARQANADGRHLILVMSPKERPNEILGVVSLRSGLPDRLELGFWLAAGCRGHGLAAEAVETILDFAFIWTSVRAVTASVGEDDLAGSRLLAQAGFAPAGDGLELQAARGGLRRVERFRLERMGWLTRNAVRPVPGAGSRPVAACG